MLHSIPSKLTCFKNTQQKPHHRHRSIAIRRTKTHSDGPPRKHEERDPAARPHALQEVIRRDFKDGIGNEEDHEGDGVLVIGHARDGEQVMACRRVEDTRIADVRAVQVAEEVDTRG